MGIGATILMIIVFPLNSFLLMQEGLSGGKQAQADVRASIQNMQGAVKGVESSKKEEPVKPKAQAVDNPEYQPVRKDGAKDFLVSNAHASVVVDADTGTILHSNDGKQQRQIASLTKLMTAVLVMEKVKNLDEEVTIDEEAVSADGTKVGCLISGNCTSQRLKIGEKISVRNLLQAMLMNSANDTAIALSKYIAGSQDAFVSLMNEKAKELGLDNTHFCTSSGLDLDDETAAAGCYSSAYDIARIAAYSLRFDTIWKIARMPSNLTIASTDGKIQHTILNTDRYLD